MDDIPGGHELIVSELRQMGPMSRGEKLVAMVFVLAALSWLFLPMFFGHMGVVVLVLAVTILVMALTEMTSNTATAATFLPVLGV